MDKPRYILGHGLELGFVTVGIIAAILLVLGYGAVNKKRSDELEERGVGTFSNEELSALGDKAVTFRYMF